MKWIFCLAFVLGNIISILAQTADDTENRFLAALDRANDQSWFLQSSPYRTIQTGEITLKFKDKDSVTQLSSYKTVSEKDKKIGEHIVYELSKNSVKEKYESITIYIKYGKYFERKDDGDWMQVENLSKNVGGNLALGTSKEYKKIQEASETNQTTVDYKYLGNEEIKNQPADAFMTIEKRAQTSRKGIRTTTKKFWFAQDGKTLKMDWEIIIEDGNDFSRSHYTQTWETDENIKIEAPVISVAH